MTGTTPALTLEGDLSPRTAAHPMAFTRTEFLRGTIGAWCTFMIELLALVIVVSLQYAVSSGPMWAGFMFVVAGYVGLIGGFGALVAILAAAPVAWAIGRMLTRIRVPAIHVLAYAVLGSVLGFAVGSVYAAVSGAAPLAPMLVGAAFCVLPPPVGWWLAARRALRLRPVHSRATRDGGADED